MPRTNLSHLTPEEKAQYKRDYNRERGKRPEIMALHKIASNAYTARNREKLRIKGQLYHAENADRINAEHRERIRRNPEPHNRAVKRWKSNNRHSAIQTEHRRRARKFLTQSQDCTARIILLRESCFCHWCCDPLTKIDIDHVTPLSRGGEHIPDNLVASCPRCNRAKSNKLVSEWLPFLKEIQETS